MIQTALGCADSVDSLPDVNPLEDGISKIGFDSSRAPARRVLKHLRGGKLGILEIQKRLKRCYVHDSPG